MSKLRNKVTRAGAALAIAATAMTFNIVSPSAALAAGSWCAAGGVNGSCPVFAGPSSSLYYAEIPKYTAVQMICWKDAQWYSVNYSSNRWFKVSTPYTSTTWMHSSEVYAQTSTPRCP